MHQLELWIGLIELRPLDAKAFGASRAYTNIVTWASANASFRKKADAVAATLEMFVAEVEREEPLSERRKNWNLTEEIDDMVIRAESNPDAIVYGNFYTFPFHEA